ncbi:hypothetical protein [Streptosporangium pseudovulgare]|nr:hypothetical protein [Streptosporangium pseudovulgare]
MAALDARPLRALAGIMAVAAGRLLENPVAGAGSTVLIAVFE